MAKKRESILQFRVTEDEDKTFREWADRVDMSFSSFARRALTLGAAQLLAYEQLRSLDIECDKEAQEKQ